MSPGDIDFNSREVYGANKVAAEQTLLDSGLPVTIIRASKVHGEGAARPREWMYVKRVIARTIASYLDHEWHEILLSDDAEPGVGEHPWDARPPIILDTQASLDLGYTPVGCFAETVPAELNWLLAAAQAGLAPSADDPFFAPLLDYAAEDRYLSGRARQACR